MRLVEGASWRMRWVEAAGRAVGADAEHPECWLDSSIQRKTGLRSGALSRMVSPQADHRAKQRRAGL